MQIAYNLPVVKDRRRRLWPILCLSFGIAVTVRALTPLELAVIVNSASSRSLAIANEYISLRRIPAKQVIYLALTNNVLDAQAELTVAEFDHLIWRPVQQSLTERGLTDQISAWVFSSDFPLRIIDGLEVLSLPGAVFFWENRPTNEEIKGGRVISPYFQGPVPDEVEMGAGASLGRFAEVLGPHRPRPSMLLAWTGARGNTLSEALAVLRQGRAADHTWPTGTVFFATNNNVRSRCRAWQYPQAVRELKGLGVPAIERPDLPRNQTVAGLLQGAEMIDPYRGNTYQAGCFAEHLTSGAGIFHWPNQTKLTAWLSAGASATYGTVSEPYALWPKFPHARLFAHLARGATLLEALAFSVASPVQGIAVGDPLMRPWVALMEAELRLRQFKPGMWNAAVALAQPFLTADFQFFLDGIPLAPPGPAQVIELPESMPGWHEVHVVVRTLEPLANWCVVQAEFLTPSAEFAVHIEGAPAHATVVPVERPLNLMLSASGYPRRLRIVHNERSIAEGPGPVLPVEASRLGLGPIRLIPEAEYDNGIKVRGAPLPLTVAALNRPPIVTHWERTPFYRGKRLIAHVADPDGDVPTIAWYAAAVLDKAGLVPNASTSLDIQEDNVVRVHPGDSVAVWCADAPRDFEGLAVRAHAKRHGHLTNQRFGLLFNMRSVQSADFFGFDGMRSEWIFGRWKDGRISAEIRRGAPLEGNDWHLLEVRRSDNGLEGWVGAEQVLSWSGKHFEQAPYGLLVHGEPVLFRDLRVAPGAAVEVASSNQVAVLVPAAQPPLWLRLADSWSVTWIAPP